MKILVLGGTGAIGVPLVKLLAKANNQVVVTSRSDKPQEENISYIQGNAQDIEFLKSLLNENYNAIIDFMVYTPSEFQNRFADLMDHTDQYIFFSSGRVYAQSDSPITEEADRLLDVCMDEDYLSTDEYALAKAREENLLRDSRKRNWTIIRPYITYNEQRLQLGVYEKENWLYRALQGRTIIFPKDIAERITSFTYGADVANAVVQLVGNPKALGQAFHAVTSEHKTWLQILDIYLDVIEEKTGKRPSVRLLDNSNGLQQVWNDTQIKYDRLYDRIFDNTKISNLCTQTIEYKTIKAGVTECLTNFLENQRWLGMNVQYEAWADKCSGERTPIHRIPGIKNKLNYLKYRYFKF